MNRGSISARVSALHLLLFALPVVCAGQLSFSNSNSISIPGSTNPPTMAGLYPSTIIVTGLTGQVVSKVTVTLKGLTHSFPSDISILLVAPNGQRSLLMAEVGGQVKYSVTNLTLTLDDDATDALPIFTNLVAGAFKPNNGWLDPYFADPGGYLPYNFPPPAPAGSSNSVSSLSIFNGTNPDGTWSLFVLGEASQNSGVISNGWGLVITAMPPLLHIALAETNVVLSWTNLASGYTLQWTPSLSPPIVWTTNALPSAVLAGGQYVVTNTIAGSKRFYRLAR